MTRTLTISLAMLFACSTLAERPELISNSVKYRDSGLRPAGGRDGDLNVAARALFGRDGVTELEVTTASFDDASAVTGTLSRVQVKAGLELEEPITRNYDASGTLASYRLDGIPLVPRETIQVQVSAATGSRTGVVTMNESVKRRPDLRFAGLSVPPHAIAGNPTNFYFVVAEWNGDVGARGDCVLRVDGIEVDRAVNIWVDRSDSVTCAMAHVFDTPGTAQVELSVENVSPADWDTANNSTGPVTVSVRDSSQVVPGGSYTATATAVTDDDEYMEQTDPTLPSRQSHYHHNVRTTNLTRLDATVPAAFDFDTLRVSLSEDSDGENLRFFTSREPLWVGNWPRADCAELSWGRSHFAYACLNDGVTTLHYTRGSTVARYYSRFWAQFTDPSTGDVHTVDFEMDMDQTSGGPKQYGSTVSMQLIATDASRAWQIDPFMTMQPWSDPEIATSGCHTSWMGPVCWWQKINRSGANGVDTEAGD